MKLLAVLTACLTAIPALADFSNVTFDLSYGNSTKPMTDTTCSDGPNGLTTRYHYTTFGMLPNFPFIGSAPEISWNSSLCGSCWNLTYTDEQGWTKTISILGVDGGPEGVFRTSLEAMNELTSSQAEQLVSVAVDTFQVDPYFCGLPDSDQ